MKQIVAYIICLPIFSLGLYFFLKCVQDIFFGLYSYRWHVTTGHITSLEYSYIENGIQVPAMEADITRPDTVVKVALAYSFIVNNKKYTSENIYFGYNYSSLFQEHSIIYDKYKSDSKIIIYYNPWKPSIAVLSPGVKSFLLLQSSAYIFIMFISSFIFIIARYYS